MPLFNADPTTSLATYTATYSSLTNATAVTKWARSKQFLLIEGQVRWTGAGGVGAFTVDLPGSEAGTPLIDTAALAGGSDTGNGTASEVGTGFWFDSGNGWLVVFPKFNDTNTIGFFTGTQVLNGNQFAASDGLNFSIKVPIVGW